MKKILLVLLMSIFIISFASAFEFDNVERYNANTRTFTINNCDLWVGVCLITGEELVNAQLTSPLNVFVAAGEDKLVGEFTFKTSDNLLDVFGGLYLEDLTNGKTISRGQQYKYKTYKEVSVDDYQNVCEEIETHNGTELQCEQIEVGSHLETRMEWTPILKPNNIFVPNTVYEIGIFVDVEGGDYGDWVPEFYSTKVSQWSTWTESLNANIVAYYKLDEQDITGSGTIIDSVQGFDGTNLGALNSTGIINTAYNFSINPINLSKTLVNELQNDTEGTISLWFKDDGVVVFGTMIGAGNASGGTPFIGISLRADKKIQVAFFDPSPLLDIRSDNNTYGDGNWHNVVFGVNSSGNALYIDNTLITSTYTAGNAASSIWFQNITFHVMKIGNASHDPSIESHFLGNIDEVAIWDRRLNVSEIAQLYNNGTGISFETSLPQITLNSPINNLNSTSSAVTFNGTAIVITPLALVNMSLWTNETGTFELRNSTLVTGTTNTTTWTRNFVDGAYLWNVQACDSDGNCAFAPQNRTLFIDALFPQITVENPTGTLDYNLIGGNETLNVTFNDINLNTCWFDYNGTNVTINGCLTGVKNSTQFLLEENNFNMTIYANDTIGNENSTFISWDYNVFENSQTFNNQTTEGASEVFLINFTKSSTLQVSTVDLIYNNTIHSAPYSVSGDEVISSISITIPQIFVDTNFSFRWNITLDNGDSILTNSNNQSASTINVDNCSSFTNLIYNFTQRDEEQKTLLSDNNTIELQVNLFDTSKTALLINFSQTFNSINPVQVCLEEALLTTVNYSSYVIVKYFANTSTNITYLVEYYNILNQTIGNTTVPKNINLFNLKQNQGTKFRLTFRDSSYVLAPNILVQVHRQYIQDNDFKIVEIPLTDSNGQTILNLVRNDIIYNFIMVNEAGDVVGTFNSQTAFCQDFTIDDCTIDLAPDSESDSAYDYNEEFDISITNPVYDNSTELISITFVTGDLQPKTQRIEIVRNNDFGNRSVCINTLTAASGTLSCDVSAIVDTDQFLFISIYVDNELAQQNTINLNATTLNFGRLNGAFYAFIMILFLVCLFMEDKRVLVLSLAVGWVVIISLGLLAGSFIGPETAGIWLLVSIFIFFWKLNKENNP